MCDILLKVNIKGYLCYKKITAKNAVLRMLLRILKKHNYLTDFEVYGFIQNKKSKYLDNKLFFFQIKIFVYNILRVIIT